MSKSLALVNGDLLVSGGRAFGIVSGRDKLIQDLSLWIYERVGTDPATPTMGSRIDGGIVNGNPLPSYIGMAADDDSLNNLRSDFIDLLTKYQQMQFQKIQAETLAYGGRNTLAADEVLESIENVNIKQVGTIILVQIQIRTLAGTLLKVTLPLNQGG